MRHVLVSLMFGLLACSGTREEPPLGEGVPGPEGGSTGTGGTGATTGTAGAPLGGQGPAAELYPHCGCVVDANTAGACRTCILDSKMDPNCAEIEVACNTNPDCVAILDELEGCDSLDRACFDAVALAHPTSFDDAVDFIECRCALCDYCDADSCE